MLVGEVFARMGLNSKQYEKDLSRLEGVTTREATTLGGIFKNAFSVALGMTVFEAVKRGFRAVVGESISFNAQMEQARIGFTTMLGSAERADKFLRDVADFAARTPFEFPELLDASKRMLAYGFAAGDVLPMMEAVGNATAALGLGAQGIDRIILALGQMRAKGKLSGEEMRQLTEAGIPAWEMLAEAMGKTTAEIMDMQSKGLIPADRAIKMLVEGMNKRFPNMMAQMEDTWEGVTSTIKDVWRMTIGAVTENLFQGLVSWLQGVRDFATNFYDTFQRYGLQRAISESFGPEVAALVSVLGATLRGFASVVSAVTGFITQYGKQIRFVAVVMGTYLVLLKTVTLAKWLAVAATTALTNSQLLLAGQSSATTGIIGFLSNVITFYKVQMLTASATTNVLAGALARVQAALYAVHTALGPIGWAILAISAALGIGVSLWSKYNQVVQNAAQQAQMDKMAQQQQDYVDSVNEAAKGTESQADALDELGKASKKNLQSFDEVHTLMDDMGDVPGLDVPTPDDMSMPGLELPDDMFVDFETELPPFGERIKGFFGWLWDGVKNTTVSTWNWITGFLGNVWQGVVDFARPIWEPLAPFFTALWGGIKAVCTAVWDAIGPYLVGAWEWLTNTAKTIWESLGPFFSGLWDGIKVVTETIWGIVQYLLATVWFSIVEVAKTVWSVLGPFFSALWSGVKTIAITTWEILKAVLVPLWEGIVEIGKAIWSVLEPFFSALWSAVKWIFETVWKPLAAWLSGVWEGIKTAAQTVWGLIQKVIVDPIAAARATVETIAGKIRDAVTAAQDKTLAAVKAVKDTLYKYIVEPFVKAKETVERIVDAAKDWGKNLMSNITDGIKSKVNSVKTAVSNAASAIKGFLGFSSPTREGPGRDADKWAPNLMKMYAQGILGNAGLIQSAANEAAKGLAAMNAFNVAPAFAGAGSAFSSPSMSAAGLAQGSASGDMTFIVKIGEDTFIEKVISGINRKSRASGETLITV